MEETKKKDGRGGKRPGAGRPPKAKPEPKIERRGGARPNSGRPATGRTKVNIQLMVKPQTRELCKKLHAMGFMYSAFFETEITKMAETLGIHIEDTEPTE